MAANNQAQKRVAILIENGRMQVSSSFLRLKMAGIEVVVLGSRMNETYKSKQGKVSIQPDGTTTEALASESMLSFPVAWLLKNAY